MLVLGGTSEVLLTTQCAEHAINSAFVLLQVIFLDSDNVPIADVAQLFDTQEYVRYGALLWPDYWDNSAAPDLLNILGLKEVPLGTTESGQMVFDKARCILIALVMQD